VRSAAPRGVLGPVEVPHLTLERDWQSQGGASVMMIRLVSLPLVNSSPSNALASAGAFVVLVSGALVQAVDALVDAGRLLGLRVGQACERIRLSFGSAYQIGVALLAPLDDRRPDDRHVLPH